jgi:hypothetical protein
MIYSTLKEVYNVDSFEKEKKHKKKENCESNKKIKDLYIQSMPSFCTDVPQSKKVAMENVKPFLDDELEQYLDYSSVASPQPVPKQLEQAQAAQQAVEQKQLAASVHQAAQAAQAAPVATPTVTVPQQQDDSKTASKQSKNDIFYKNLINIALFVFIGILIIFLCDQITEIAVNIGMKKTVAILEPYIARLERLEKSRHRTN